MQGNDFERASGDMIPRSSYDIQQQERWIAIGGGLSLLLAAVAGVMLWLARRRRPTRLERAEAALARGASSVEQAARTVRKQGPGLVVRGAERVEQAARSMRKQGPPMLAQRAESVEQAARTVRKQGPPMLRRGYARTEQAVDRTRAIGAGIAEQTTPLVERAREVGGGIAGGAQTLAERVKGFRRDGEG